jgi:hypothetical protein
MDSTYTRAGKTKGHKKSSHGKVMGDGTWVIGKWMGGTVLKHIKMGRGCEVD